MRRLTLCGPFSLVLRHNNGTFYLVLCPFSPLFFNFLSLAKCDCALVWVPLPRKRRRRVLCGRYARGVRVVNPNKKALEAEGWGKRSLDARRFPFLSAPFDSGSATIVGCPLIGPCGCDRLRRVQLSKKSDKMWICRWLHSAEAGCGAQKEIA